MGVVVLARHEGLGELVVLKVLRGEVAQSPDNLERLRREARTMARLRSEHIVRVTDVGTLDGGEPFLVMEYVRGATLRQLLSERRALSIEEVVEYALQVCEGLAAAHASGIVHRDIKPSNLIVTERPDGSPLVKILDFGIAKSESPASLILTETSAMLGSPLYMAPEQMRDAHRADARSDLWALGVTLYEALTGQLPFPAFTTAAVIAAVLSDDPIPPRQHVPGLPEGLEAVVLRCLRRDPAERFTDVGQLALALAPFGSVRAMSTADRAGRILRRGPVRDEEPAPVPAPAASDSGLLTASRTATQARLTASTDPGGPAPARPARPARPLGLGLAAVAALGLAALFWRQRPAPASGGLVPAVSAAVAVATEAPAASAPSVVTAVVEPVAPPPAVIAPAQTAAVSAAPAASAAQKKAATPRPVTSPRPAPSPRSGGPDFGPRQ